MDTLLNKREAAQFLGVSEDRLIGLVADKVIPAYIIAGQALRFKKDELEPLKDLLREGPHPESGRAFGQVFIKLKGAARFREALAANDIYLLAVGAALLVLFFIFAR